MTMNLFAIGSSGVKVNRLAMEVVGENIANVNTKGYSRQEAIMGSATVTSRYGVPLGTGVQVQTIRRVYDGMLQAQITTANSTYQQSTVRQSALEQIESSFNEFGSDGLGAAIEGFFSSWQDLATNPAGTAERQSLLSNARILTDSFHHINNSLNTVAESANNNLTGITQEISSKAAGLSLVNRQILSTQAAGGNANELLDQRDLLMREMSEMFGVTATLANDGTATVMLPGGETLVSGIYSARMYTNVNGAGLNEIMLTPTGDPAPVINTATDANVTATVGGPGNSLGTIGGALEVRDTMVPAYLVQLDELASRIVSAVNTQHSAGYGADGTTGINFFNPAGGTSQTIGVDPGLTTAKIAAALPTASNPAPTTTANNVNAAKIAAIQDAALVFTLGNTTVGEFYSSLVSKVGIDTQYAQNTSSQGEAFLRQMNTLRASKSEVSLDEELTNLAKYQQAFQGSAKIINAATEMMDVILGMMR